MKKVKKTIPQASALAIDYDQLSQVKGGGSWPPHDLFTGDAIPAYDLNPPPE